GIASSRIRADGSDRNRSAGETIKQIDTVRKLARRQPGSGHTHWSVSALLDDRGGVKAQLLKESYQDRALVPESPWLARGSAPTVPKAWVQGQAKGLVLRWEETSSSTRWWVVQMKSGVSWRTERVLPEGASGMTLTDAPAWIAVRAMDAAGRLSAPAVMRKG
ncbi:MAG: hypothetical protein AAGJ31_15375, partial [Verrucomicrobiota bacterium]